MNTVIFLTDTQPTRLVGAYGEDWVQTPHLDQLAEDGIRFDRAYTPCPLCTPARSAIFTGLMPACNGAWANEMTPGYSFTMMGEALQRFGMRAGYSGKWHLDGAGYHGNGLPGGGFEPEWWFDGKNYVDWLGKDQLREYVTAITGNVPVKGGITPERAEQMRQHDSAAAMRATGCTIEKVWGHQVANRAIDFLNQVGDEPFVLIVSLDEPHGPFVTPPEYQELFKGEIPAPENYCTSLEGKPSLQQHQAKEFPLSSWEDFIEWRRRHLRCNTYVDHEIGRVIHAIDELHADDTTIIATSDHGDMMGSHGLLSKGAMMYEECARVPFIVRHPGGPAGVSCDTPVSLLDLFPTVLDLEEHEVPPILQGKSLKPLFEDPGADIERDATFIQFNRFGHYHDGYGGLYPIRCVVDQRYKLAINLHDDRDEFYDLQEDPGELNNQIDSPRYAVERDRLHDLILVEMDRINDPFRGRQWGDRPWRTVKPEAYFHGLEERPGLHRERGFEWDPNNE